MENVFGIPMSSIMLVLLVAFGLCLAVGAYILIRNRIIFRLGVRNIPRRPVRAVLIVVGLMLSTVIIAAALTTGDTFNHSIRSSVHTYLGQTDELVMVRGNEAQIATGQQPGMVGPATGLQPGATVLMNVLADLRTSIADVPAIDGVMGVITEQVPVVVPGSGRAEPTVTMTGLEPQAVEPFGGLSTLDGNPVDLTALTDGEAVVSETLAARLQLRPGDTFTIFVRNQQHHLTVRAIADDSFLTGVRAATTPGGFAVPLPYAQELLGLEDQVNMIAVSNRGDAVSGVDRTDEAMAALDSVLAGTQFEPVAVKQNRIEEAERASNQLTSLFGVLGMFSIAAGLLLIFLIFMLLAAERKPEMGVARAVGLKRRHLTQMYLAEGLTYDLAAAAVGALLGVGVAFAMADIMAQLASDFFVIEPAASWRSLVVAYTLGVVVTFVTIAISSYRVSRLNIVSAIRDIPQPTPQRQSRTWLIVGLLGLIMGPAVLWSGIETGNLALFGLGVSLVPLSLAAILRRFGASPRLVYTAAALLVLVFWLLPSALFDRIVPTLQGDVEMFVISGIMMVASTTVLIVWNIELVTGLIGILGRTFSRWLPAVKTAVAYPLASKGRTGMTIAMFSLIVFSLVAMATINDNFQRMFTTEEATGGWDILARQGPVNPIEDFVDTAATHGIEANRIAAVARVPVTQSRVRMAGAEAWGSYTVRGVSDEFINHSEMPLQTRANGFETDDEVWQALRDNPGYAVVDSRAVTMAGTQVGGPDFQLSGVTQDDETMQPTPIEVAGGGDTQELTVIGVVDQRVAFISGLFIPKATFDAIYPQSMAYGFFIQATEGVDHTELAEDLETALVPFGMQVDSVRGLLDERLAVNQGFVYLIEGFMALGLVVGIAALGVVSYRSVTERRQQIGMLRAIGYQREMVAASFLVESAVITLLGVVSGTVLALWLSWQLTTSGAFGIPETLEFTVPWSLLLLFTGIAIVASLTMAYIPARRASRVAIADALRYE